MATNEILPFAQGVGANVQTQADYAAEALRTSGNVAGIARSNVNNKALRQASVIAAGIGQFIADRQANNVTDSATPAQLSSWMAAAVQSLSSIDYLNTTRIDVASAATVNLTTLAPNTRNIRITGTTTITAFTVAIGQLYFVQFSGALTLTNNANIVTQRGANITTAAGDTCIIRATAVNVVEVLAYTVASVTGTGSKVFSVSPAFTGAPAAPTPAQFDNDTSLATTAFVQRALGNASSTVQLSVNTTLTAAHAGAMLQVTLPGITLTLPSVAGYTSNATIFSGFSNTGDFTLASGSANISNGGSLVSSVTIKNGSHFIVVSTDNANWFLLGTAALPTISSYFGASLAANGYQKLPSGLIIQWVTGSAFGANATESTQEVIFPIAFPNAVFSCVVSMVIASSSNSADAWFQLYGTSVTRTFVQKQVPGSAAVSVTQTPKIIAIGY